ncbi:unnamed protein product [Euphydryas editha]|uniref:Helitron helicase-like domain-containing protein n=1 Tax=Euphydryas editha TaxID=104508 RepID=A0AAU9VBE2_EUPED|nr:unnamed protein product [Euphydryas editha]
MREISVELERNNPFVRSSIAMKHYCQRVEKQNKEIRMLIVHHDLDLRRFSDAIQTDVAVIFSTVDILDSSLDPLAYPQLSPNGDPVSHINIAHNAPTISNSRAPRNKLTMLQYTAYRLAIREEFSTHTMLHHSQKLFLLLIVDMYMRIEGSRLHFIRQNQTILRSEFYNNLTNYLESNINASNVGRGVIKPSSFNGSPRNIYPNYLNVMSIVQHFITFFIHYNDLQSKFAGNI